MNSEIRMLVIMSLVILLVFIVLISKSRESENSSLLPLKFSYSFVIENNKIEVDEGNLCINNILSEEIKPFIILSNNSKVYLIKENEGRSLRLVNPKNDMDVLITQLDKNNFNNPSILILPTKYEAGFRRYTLSTGANYKYILEYSFEKKEPKNMKSIVSSFQAKEKE